MDLIENHCAKELNIMNIINFQGFLTLTTSK